MLSFGLPVLGLYASIINTSTFLVLHTNNSLQLDVRSMLTNKNNQSGAVYVSWVQILSSRRSSKREEGGCQTVKLMAYHS